MCVHWCMLWCLNCCCLCYFRRFTVLFFFHSSLSCHLTFAIVLRFLYVFKPPNIVLNSLRWFTSIVFSFRNTATQVSIESHKHTFQFVLSLFLYDARATASTSMFYEQWIDCITPFDWFIWLFNTLFYLLVLAPEQHFCFVVCYAFPIHVSTAKQSQHRQFNRWREIHEIEVEQRKIGSVYSGSASWSSTDNFRKYEMNSKPLILLLLCLSQLLIVCMFVQFSYLSWFSLNKKKEGTNVNGVNWWVKNHDVRIFYTTKKKVMRKTFDFISTRRTVCISHFKSIHPHHFYIYMILPLFFPLFVWSSFWCEFFSSIYFNIIQ